MQWIFNRISNAFAIELRMLATFRVILGLIVAWGLWGRFQIRDLVFGEQLAGSVSDGLISSELSRSVWTPWHWSVLWMDQLTAKLIYLVSGSLPQMGADQLQAAGVAGGGQIQSLPDAMSDAPADGGFVLDTLQQTYLFFASSSYVDLIFILGIVAATFFCLGLFTKVSNVILWIIVVSIQVRMPLFNSGADTIEKLFLFWMLFLPAGAVGSLDATFFPRQGFWRKRINQTTLQLKQLGSLSANQSVQPLSISNFATAAVMMQLVLMYFFAGVSKCNGDWFTGAAVEKALGWDLIVKPLGHWLQTKAWLTGPATWGVLGVELFLPLLVFCPGLYRWTRRPTIVFLVMIHLGIALTMTIGTFSAIAIAGWLLFLNGSGLGIKTWWKDLADQSVVPLLRMANSTSPSGTAAQLCVAMLLGLVLWWNVSLTPWGASRNIFPQPLKPLVCNLALDQHFPMFGDVPKTNWTWQHQVVDSSGGTIDARLNLPSPLNLHGGVAALAESQSQFLWRQLHVNLIYNQSKNPVLVRQVVENLRKLELSRLKLRAGDAAQEIQSKFRVVDPGSGEVLSW